MKGGSLQVGGNNDMIMFYWASLKMLCILTQVNQVGPDANLHHQSI